jgi:hypothetical protein
MRTTATSSAPLRSIAPASAAVNVAIPQAVGGYVLKKPKDRRLALGCSPPTRSARI